MAKVYVLEFTLDETDGPWTEAELYAAKDEIENSVEEAGGLITEYIHEKQTDEVNR